MNYATIIFLSFFLTFAVGEVHSYSFPGEEEETAASDVGKKGKSFFADGNTKIWLNEGISLSKRTAVILDRSVDATKVLLTPQFLDEVTLIFRNRLAEAGLDIVESGQKPPANAIRIKPIITKYEPGSAGARWLLAEMGATVCIIRATIINPENEMVIGEVISWRRVATGGLFSVGADKYIPRETAEAIAEVLIEEIRK